MNNSSPKALPPNISAEEQAENLRALHLADRVLQMLLKSYQNNDMDSVKRMLQTMSDHRTCGMIMGNNHLSGAILH